MSDSTVFARLTASPLAYRRGVLSGRRKGPTKREEIITKPEMRGEPQGKCQLWKPEDATSAKMTNEKKR